ncbi:MAG: hypothetical protein ACRC8R_11995 [Aeromonas hydrophila]
MGAIIFKIFIYYMLFKGVLLLLNWLFESAIPAVCESIAEFIEWVRTPPHPNEVARRERERLAREADINTAEGRFKDAQRRNASTAEFNATRWERAGQGHLHDGAHSFTKGKKP